MSENNKHYLIVMARAGDNTEDLKRRIRDVLHSELKINGVPVWLNGKEEGNNAIAFPRDAEKRGENILIKDFLEKKGYLIYFAPTSDKDKALSDAARILYRADQSFTIFSPM
jgi:hypothetical protein